jgi:hypothetical protein
VSLTQISTKYNGETVATNSNLLLVLAFIMILAFEVVLITIICKTETYFGASGSSSTVLIDSSSMTSVGSILKLKSNKRMNLKIKKHARHKKILKACENSKF